MNAARDIDVARGSAALPAERISYQTGDEIEPAREHGQADPGLADFVHLAVHSEFSITDGLIKVKDLASRIRDLNMPAVALTDRTNLFGLVKFYTACRDAGIKPLVGADLDYEGADGTLCRCVVLVADATGYANLLRLVSRAYTDAPARGHGDGHGHGRVAREAILDAAEGLIVLLGAASDVGAASGSPDVAARRLAAWRNRFADRVYLEVVRTGRRGEEQFVLEAVDLALREGVPVVASNDVRFMDTEDFEAHETRVCIQEGRVLTDARRERRYSDQQYLRSPAEMRALFADLPEAIDNTVEIAKRCNCEIELGTYHLPEYPVPSGATLGATLREEAVRGLEGYLAAGAQAGESDADAYHARLEYELGIIDQMGFAGYFLIVQEFVLWARQNDVPVGCRGSGTASLVAFCLGITDLDPLRYGLIFERLLNPERVSMPDLDIDFCMEGRERVIAHVAERYGHDAVSQIVTFGTMAARLVVRDVARAQDKPFGLADRLSKMIPFEVGMTLEKALERESELRDFVDRDEDAAEIMDMAYKLEGIVRNIGKHAGGVVIAPTTLTDYVPLYADHAGGGVVSQFDLNDVEEAGLVKFDFLGLKTLTIIDWAVRAINEERARTGEELIDVMRLPLDDPATYELLKTAETTAVFQLESEGMKDLIRRLQPDTIDDIIALVALYRPGPLQSGAVDDYIDRKHGKKPVSYPHEALRDPLAGTYGVMLYQEQVMNMAQRLAGFSLGQADLLRRAMAKKKPEEMIEVRRQFLAGTDDAGVDQRIANDIFDQVEKFAGYAFPKAHSASYAMLTFRAAWLKTHYPAQYMAAVLSADMHNTDKVVTLVDEVKRLRLTVHPPDVNLSATRFSATTNGIRYGLGAVRGVGEGPVEAMIAAREDGAFESLADFCHRVDARRANKRVLEALIRAGAMDSFGASEESIELVRARLLEEMPATVQGAERAARDAEIGIDDMFGGVPEGVSAIVRDRVRALTKRDMLDGEKEALGFYLTGHPIDDYLHEIREFCPRRIATLSVRDGRQAAAGLVVSMRSRRGRNGSMGFLVLDDRSARIEVAVFGDVYQQHRAKLIKDAVLVVLGEVQRDDFDGKLKLKADSIMTIAEARNYYAEHLAVRLAADRIDDDLSARLRDTLRPHLADRGGRVVLDYRGASAGGRIVLGNAWRVDLNDELLLGMREAFGDEAVSVRYAG
ncbi:MAG: DNA polymerase III subunit alpha [Gammaproteobacteria bacterium]|nr:DNA polymerase III subunit alpha [Gammaproteobacteria bacterium]